MVFINNDNNPTSTNSQSQERQHLSLNMVARDLAEIDNSDFDGRTSMDSQSFQKLDLRSGYYHIFRIGEEAEKHQDSDENENGDQSSEHITEPTAEWMERGLLDSVPDVLSGVDLNADDMQLVQRNMEAVAERTAANFQSRLKLQYRQQMLEMETQLAEQKRKLIAMSKEKAKSVRNEEDESLDVGIVLQTEREVIRVGPRDPNLLFKKHRETAEVLLAVQGDSVNKRFLGMPIMDKENEVLQLYLRKFFLFDFTCFDENLVKME